MRILHTSDWHLGQYFLGHSRQTEHQKLIDWLVGQTRAHRVDAVLIAGDIFDTGAPPSYARELYNQLILALRDAGVGLTVLAGNHDSVAMLQESRELLALLNTFVIPSVQEDPNQQVQVLKTRDGTPGAIVCAIPFIRPRDVLLSIAGQTARDKQASLQDAIQTHYQALFALAERKRAELGMHLPIIATGHLTTVGASASESVREIYVGSLEAFPTAAFPAADYIALGHIHRPQKVGGFDHIRYSGSPIALSFDEARQHKQMLLVDVSTDGLEAVTPIEVPCFQPMLSVKGSLKELAASIHEAAAGATEGATVWLEVIVSADDYLSDLQTRIEDITKGLPVEVLRIRRERSAQQNALQAQAKETLNELTPDDVFARRLQAEMLDDELRTQLTSMYREVVAGIGEAEAS
ncbi:Nuclease SbcCD subunit D [Caballeronia arationis]|jgi:exonuclease SbcD|uniref:Nuclease SbcCD subunit D n=1 Tax=Caballeronia arationis TaxID=1777142 RepID=A0A7Z7IC49_9BURK|nr:exonuclease subunit SbcD [Caballeronia arationis]SAK43391.1 Nuclease SbcCD subunit D [Caballeronia arationis]SOE83058.1 Exodeoxyribonuclease I subunit D [Caballeronia arationis]